MDLIYSSGNYKRRTLTTEIQKVIRNNANKFEIEFQSSWHLVNFSYNTSDNKATAFVLTIHNASVYAIYSIVALELMEWITLSIRTQYGPNKIGKEKKNKGKLLEVKISCENYGFKV